MGLTPTNSVSLPACFSLKLKKPMAMSLSLARKISEITQIQCYESGTQKPLIPLIIKQASSSSIDFNTNKGLFVVSNSPFKPRVIIHHTSIGSCRIHLKAL